MADQQKKAATAVKVAPDFQTATAESIGAGAALGGILGHVTPLQESAHQQKERERPEPLQIARVQFPEPGYAIERGNRKTVLEGTWDPRTQVTTIALPGGDELKVHVSQAITRIKKLPVTEAPPG